MKPGIDWRVANSIKKLHKKGYTYTAISKILRKKPREVSILRSQWKRRYGLIIE